MADEYTYEQVMGALRKAHAAGNTEHARRLAVMARGLKTPSGPRLIQEPDQRRPWESFQDVPADTPPERHAGAMPFVNRGIATVAGGPADIIRGAVNLLPGMKDSLPEPAFGRKAIESSMGAMGATYPPEGQAAQTIPEHMGQVVGEASAYMFPVTKAVSVLAKGAGTTGRVASSIYSSMIKHPYLTMASELSASTAAGGGRGVAEREFPDSPGLQTGIELGAGLAGAILPTVAANKTIMIAIRAGKNLYRKMLVPFTKKGGKYRAGEFLKGEVADAAKASAETGAPSIGDLPPAVASGEKKIIELYKGLTGLDPVSDAAAIEKISNSITKLDSQMRSMGYGSPELMAEITKKRIAAIELGMDRRTIDAIEAAQKRLDKIPVAQRKAAESRIVGEELRGVMHEEQAATQKLWNKVDKDFKVDTDTTRKTYETLKDGLGQAQKVDIPATLKGSTVIRGKKAKGKSPPLGKDTRPEVIPGEAPALPPKGRSGFITSETKGEMLDFAPKETGGRDFSTTIREMQSLRSKLLETARQARKDGQWNKARIAGDVADAILVDIEAAATPEAADLKAAIAATKQFKTRFESGETGRILGYSKSGAPAINPDLTLEQTVGRFGERGAIDIEKLVATPAAKRATEAYLGRSFTDYAASTGTVSPVKAQRWIKTNEAILDEYPDLRNLLSDSADAQEFADATRVKMDARKAKLRDPAISVSAKFLNKASLNKEITNIFKERYPSKFANELVKQARKDTSGDALAGLRAGFVEHILDTSTNGAFNSQGRQTLSGNTMTGFIKNNEPTLRMVFDNTQINRMKGVAKEFSKLEVLEGAKGRTKTELNDLPSKILEMTGRLGGARLGGEVGGKSNLGGSLQYATIFSGRGRKFMNWLSHDKAKQFIQDAILSDDPKMLQALLDPMSKPKPKKQDLILLNKQLNAWLLSTGERVMTEDDQ